MDPGLKKHTQQMCMDFSESLKSKHLKGRVRISVLSVLCTFLIHHQRLAYLGPTCTCENVEFLVKLTFDFFFITAMTPNELAAIRERYTEEMFPGLDMPMDQVICPGYVHGQYRLKIPSEMEVAPPP